MKSLLRRIIRKILIEEINQQGEFSDDILEYVYRSTPINRYGRLEDYINYVNEYYRDYYITRHTSPSNNILFADIKTPEQMGIKNYNSVDGFFVSLDLNPKADTSWNKSGNMGNYYVMIPKGLNFLNTDYEFSNIPNFFNNFQGKGNKGNIFKYIGDKVRELGYDVIVPEEGKNELIVVNTKDLIVLGSIKDINQFKNI